MRGRPRPCWEASTGRGKSRRRGRFDSLSRHGGEKGQDGAVDGRVCGPENAPCSRGRRAGAQRALAAAVEAQPDEEAPGKTETLRGHGWGTLHGRRRQASGVGGTQVSSELGVSVRSVEQKPPRFSAKLWGPLVHSGWLLGTRPRLGSIRGCRFQLHDMNISTLTIACRNNNNG